MVLERNPYSSGDRPVKILALGAGAMGEAAAVTAASFDDIDQLIIADLDLATAQRVAGRCHGKARAARIDATRHNDLVALMTQADATMNCVGPFFRFGVTILEAAIAAGRHYFDICDDPEPTLEMFQLTDRARAAGITAVVGAGASPGITNLLARLACESLDSANELVTAWSIDDPDDPEPTLEFSTAIVHWMQQISGTVLEWRERGLQHVRPLREESLDYPGRGVRRVWTVGHPEPIALARTYPTLTNSYCAMVMSSLQARLFHRLQDIINRGEMPLEQAAHELVEMSHDTSWLSSVVETVSGWFDGPALPQLFALAKGTLDGSPAITAASMRAFPAEMAQATGVPLALTVRLFAEGKITARGVHSPEAVIDPREFFDLLHPYCRSPRHVDREYLIEVATNRYQPAKRQELATTLGPGR
jgi:saccharopine dehydrogenase-like NADP-dependent oxidoreductase